MTLASLISPANIENISKQRNQQQKIKNILAEQHLHDGTVLPKQPALISHELCLLAAQVTNEPQPTGTGPGDGVGVTGLGTTPPPVVGAGAGAVLQLT